MPEQKTEKAVTAIKAQLFPIIGGALLSVILFLVQDMHSDMKDVMRRLPLLELRVDFLEDGRLKARAESIPRVKIPMKHEEPITYDSLLNN